MEESAAEKVSRSLLSLDGGGVRGLASLLIIRQVMVYIKKEQNLLDLPRPCDYFDLMGGTSTGGLIAIMLGRLEMEVDECIKVYRAFAKEVFGKKNGAASRVFKAVRGRAWYDSKKIEEVIKRIIHDRLGDGEAPLLDNEREERSGGCRIFVCATKSENREYELLRSYENDRRAHECKLWEAARATSAASLFFDPVKFQKSGAVFIDGVTVLPNPVREVVNEAKEIWSPRSRSSLTSSTRIKNQAPPAPPAPWFDTTIGCLVSIGTGQRKYERVGTKLHEVLPAFAKIATNPERLALSFEKEELGCSLKESQRYYRLDVVHGLQEVKMDDSEDADLEIIEAATSVYLERNGEILRACAQKLIEVKQGKKKVEIESDTVPNEQQFLPGSLLRNESESKSESAKFSPEIVDEDIGHKSDTRRPIPQVISKQGSRRLKVESKLPNVEREDTSNNVRRPEMVTGFKVLERARDREDRYVLASMKKLASESREQGRFLEAELLEGDIRILEGSWCARKPASGKVTFSDG